MKHLLKLTVNGMSYELEVQARETLAEVLRYRLGLTGTKQACSDGNCGACTVLLNGKPVLSCLTLALKANGKKVLTVEGLAEGEKLHPIQQAFIDHFAVQCGFCTPGMIMSAKGLLDENPNPSEEEVREAIKGNLCRCTGYVKIVEAILNAAKASKPKS